MIALAGAERPYIYAGVIDVYTVATFVVLGLDACGRWSFWAIPGRPRASLRPRRHSRDARSESGIRWCAIVLEGKLRPTAESPQFEMAARAQSRVRLWPLNRCVCWATHGVAWDACIDYNRAFRLHLGSAARASPPPCCETRLLVCTGRWPRPSSVVGFTWCSRRVTASMISPTEILDDGGAGGAPPHRSQRG